MRQKKELGMVLIFLGLFLGYALLEASQRGLPATFANPVFLGQANLLNLTRSIGLFGIFSVAMGTVIITGGIDLSVGSMFALLGVILAYLLGPYNFPWPLAVAIIILLAMLLGLFHGLLVSRARLQPFVVTSAACLPIEGSPGLFPPTRRSGSAAIPVLSFSGRLQPEASSICRPLLSFLSPSALSWEWCYIARFMADISTR